MRRPHRYQAILSRLGSDGSVLVDELADEFGVSESTIRRDLSGLASQLLLVRTRGGAVAQDVVYELSLRYRSSHRAEQKRRIGAAAAALVPHGGVVGISGGTTTTEVARALADRQGLTVVTNALNIATELAIRPNIHLTVTGGLARSASFELVGPLAEQTIDLFNLDLLFLGVSGIDVNLGCTTHDSVEAQTNAAMVRQAKRVVVVADTAKIGEVAFARICHVGQVDILITEETSGNSATPRETAIEEEIVRLMRGGLEVKRV